MKLSDEYLVETRETYLVSRQLTGCSSPRFVCLSIYTFNMLCDTL